MQLFFSVHETGVYNENGLDLDDLWNENSDSEEFFQALVVEIAAFAIKQGVKFGQVVGFTLDEGGDETEITQTEYDLTWIREVTQLMEHVKDQRAHWIPDGALMARINDLGWNYVDFDSDLSTMEDEYHAEFDGDYEEYAREWMDNTDESIPEHLEYYFDYRAYGEAMVDDFDRCSWDGQEYLFSR